MRVARLAFAYRQRFHKDVVIDMVCYRRHGHNEGDDPSYTQPLMYKRIEARRSVRKLYTEALVKRGDITLEEAEAGARRLPAPAAGRARRDPQARARRGRSRGQAAAAGRSACCPTSTPASTARRRSTRCLRRHRHRARGLHRPPEAGQAVRARRRRCSRRTARSTGRLAEALAFGSLLLRGHRRCASPARTPAGARSPTATRSWSTTRPAPSTCRSAHLGARQGTVLDLRLAAVGVRRARLRVRLLGRRTRTPS